jgi:phage shock protein C
MKGVKMNDIKTLTRSKSNRMIAGVCAGLADYLNIDPTVVRLLFVLGLFLAGPGIAIAYLIMAIVTPEG